mmetsp:Transcript_2850/g.6630  ORF Transcript_2850/g.6630 Transcript_2850/m.6630 type:complete len:307 (+) Transcript_2850:314-1234(+)|eukprot:CAMPEP_0177616876 /NCGR_PEP_ID=MMETSP0419_2-20121207/24483_1 /TAXON_ID=582737 /ORGANISM="Tetraselmis sp., Strain GSL018" /LENGTH=306 /DNA_ID=CAMNT_0019115151 /DNA_START=229 /DNA_END=1149 /DNA_ORIENTATION=-
MHPLIFSARVDDDVEEVVGMLEELVAPEQRGAQGKLDPSNQHPRRCSARGGMLFCPPAQNCCRRPTQRALWGGGCVQRVSVSIPTWRAPRLNGLLGCSGETFVRQAALKDLRQGRLVPRSGYGFDGEGGGSGKLPGPPAVWGDVCDQHAHGDAGAPRAAQAWAQVQGAGALPEILHPPGGDRGPQGLLLGPRHLHDAGGAPRQDEGRLLERVGEPGSDRRLRVAPQEDLAREVPVVDRQVPRQVAVSGVAQVVEHAHGELPFERGALKVEPSREGVCVGLKHVLKVAKLLGSDAGQVRVPGSHHVD